MDDQRMKGKLTAHRESEVEAGSPEEEVVESLRTFMRENPNWMENPAFVCDSIAAEPEDEKK